jgi:hypothetical protein
MRYLMFIKHAEDTKGVVPPPTLMKAMEAFVGDNLKSGALIDTAGLRPTSEAKRVRSTGGKLVTTDGPFTEAKEVVGGYALVEAKSTEEAMDLATKFMELHRLHWPEFECACEVRQLDN